MSIRSFLVYVAPGVRDDVTRALEAVPACEVYPAENRDVVVVVSDLPDRETEQAFDAQLAAIPGVLGAALVAGYDR